MAWTGNISRSWNVIMLMVLYWNGGLLVISHGASFDVFDICSTPNISNISETQGSVTSPGYPSGNYPNNKDCRINFSGRMIKFFIVNLYIEWSYDCKADWLKIFDGAALFATYCGANHPSQQTIEFHSGNVSLEFRSDSSEAYKGFKINFLVTDSSVFELCVSPSTVPENNTKNGIITSPDYPKSYRHLDYKKCSVVAPYSDHVFEILVRDFILDAYDCGYTKCDWMTVYQDENPITDRISGVGPSSSILVYPRVQVRVEFSSSSYKNSRGFVLEYQGRNKFYEMCIPADQHNLRLNQEQVTVISPNHPNNYYHNKDCAMNIEAPVNYVIQIVTVSFMLQSGASPNCHNCSCDWFGIEEVDVSVNGQGTTNAVILDKQCGDSSFNITSSTNQIKLLFSSDNDIASKGFSLIAKAIPSLLPTTVSAIPSPLPTTVSIAPEPTPLETSNTSTPTGYLVPVIGGAVGGLVLLVLSVVLLIFILRRRSRKNVEKVLASSCDTEFSTSTLSNVIHNHQDSGDTKNGYSKENLNKIITVELEDFVNTEKMNQNSPQIKHTEDLYAKPQKTNQNKQQIENIEDLYAKPQKMKRPGQIFQMTSIPDGSYDNSGYGYGDIADKPERATGVYFDDTEIIHSQNKGRGDDEVEMIENDLYISSGDLSDNSHEVKMIDNEIYSGQ